MPCGKLNQLAGHDLVEAVNARDTVAEGDDRADLVDLDALLVVLNLLAKQLCYLICLNLCHVVPFPSGTSNPVANRLLVRLSFGRDEPSFELL